MKKVIVLRHGDYSRQSGDLSNYGRRQLEHSAKRIEEEHGTFDPKTWLILHSPARRAQSSALILANHFIRDGIEHGADHISRDGDLSVDYHRASRAARRIRDERPEIELLILVTHKPELEMVMRETGVSGSCGTGCYITVDMDKF